MTRKEVISIPGFHPDTAKAIANYLRCTAQSKPEAIEPTSLVRNEGRMQGRFEAATSIDSLMIPEKPETTPATQQFYAPPKQS